MKPSDVKICLICSHGGHFHELTRAINGVEGNFYWVTFLTKHTSLMLQNEKHYFVIDPIVSGWKYVLNGFQSLRHLVIERPDIIISTGAGIAIPTIILGKFIFRSRVIYIESAAAVQQPSKTGRFVQKYADLFLIQWESLLRHYPNAVHVGIL